MENKVISSFNFSRLVSKTYGRPYDFQQQDGCIGSCLLEFSVSPDAIDSFDNESIEEKLNDDGTTEMGVKFESWLKRDPEQPLSDYDKNESWVIELWWFRNFYPDIQMVINDMYEKGILKEKTFFISIDAD